jgi:hypothetical protein
MIDEWGARNEVNGLPGNHNSAAYIRIRFGRRVTYSARPGRRCSGAPASLPDAPNAAAGIRSSPVLSRWYRP